jgi:hypothetical protein
MLISSGKKPEVCTSQTSSICSLRKNVLLSTLSYLNIYIYNIYLYINTYTYICIYVCKESSGLGVAAHTYNLSTQEYSGS